MKHPTSNSWKDLLSRYLNNQITKAELQDLLHQAANEDSSADLNAAMKEVWEEGTPIENEQIDWDAHFETIINDSPALPKPQKVTRWRRWAVAAGIALLIAAGTHLIREHEEPVTPTITTTKQYDKTPGTNGGILTLADGSKIALDSVANGTLATQGNTKISNRQGRIVYNALERGDEPMMFNTITTPKSKQFQLVLADGSGVWLNAASSVRFPTSFNGKERRVEITGEAYFEIAKATKNGSPVPFIVTVNGMEIRVLGTHFNVNAYYDEATIKTTLLEGSIIVSTGDEKQLLKPGEQAQLDRNGKFTIWKDIDTDSEIAWKNGYFSFNNADLLSIMRQISRWYNVDIVYEGKLPNRRFGGEISRNTNVSEVLKILEESKIHFRVEEKRIVVLP